MSVYLYSENQIWRHSMCALCSPSDLVFFFFLNNCFGFSKYSEFCYIGMTTNMLLKGITHITTTITQQKANKENAIKKNGGKKLFTLSLLLQNCISNQIWNLYWLRWVNVRFLLYLLSLVICCYGIFRMRYICLIQKSTVLSQYWRFPSRRFKRKTYMDDVCMAYDSMLDITSI